MVRGQESYKWYQGFSQCDHAIRQKNPGRQGYEIGLKAREDGAGFDLLWDDFDSGLREAAGKDAHKLKQEYSAAVATKHYSRQGYRVQRTTKQDGTLVLSATR